MSPKSTEHTLKSWHEPTMFSVSLRRGITAFPYAAESRAERRIAVSRGESLVQGANRYRVCRRKKKKKKGKNKHNKTKQTKSKADLLYSLMCLEA